jgi:hypothetical protein
MRVTSGEHPDIAHVRLSDTDMGVFRDAAEFIYPAAREWPEAVFLDEMEKEASGLAAFEFAGLAGMLEEFGTHGSWRVVVVHAPPPVTAELIPTPDRYLEPVENGLLKSDIHRGLILGLAEWYGYGYDSQQPGNIHNNVIAIAKESRQGISANAHLQLGFHTEDASYNLGEGYNVSPDWLTLHFLRNPDRVPSLVSLPDLGELSADARDALEEPFYINRTNPGQGGDANNADRPVSVIYYEAEDGSPWVRLNTEFLEEDIKDGDYSAGQRAALAELKALIDGAAVELDNRPGDIVLVDNRRTWHGRKEYGPNQKPRYDGYDRWQRRLVAADSAERIQAHEIDPRIVSPAKMFGAMAVGTAATS